MANEQLVAVEIGTRSVRVIIGEALSNGSVLVNGLGVVPSRGVRKAEIVDPDAALDCVKQALIDAEEQSGVVINQVYLMFSAGSPLSIINQGQVPVLSEEMEITQEDIDAVMDNARAVNLPTDRQLVHSIRQNFEVDEQKGIRQPLGMEGAKLRLSMLILHATRNNVRNAVRVVQGSDVQVANVAFGGLCAGLSVLNADQKDRGVIVIDLGAGTTDFVVYANHCIAYASSIAVGGDHVTNDIAHGLNISGHHAERLKLKHGSAVLDLGKLKDVVTVEQGSGLQHKNVQLVDLNTIINVRMEETLQLIRKDLKKADLLHRIGAGVVFTGGGARMKDICEVAAKIFQLPCHIGKTRNVNGLPEITDAPENAAIIGAIKYNMKFATQDGSRRGIGDLIKSIFGR